MNAPDMPLQGFVGSVLKISVLGDAFVYRYLFTPKLLKRFEGFVIVMSHPHTL
ncbi:hypothetical protein [Candidatus Bathycorpusculum sp.]|uniref:hypothetical protein n=1 Tax=Candidatus Bathycorpusculum sp. TaxID=2994959 RepID=UPI00282EDE50|nr:hypothetical protein [Candidatus Termitimicrobium sp.]